MPVSITMSFPAGRFHATPWGHHVNEGLPEWPPSPWRLLRALVATWKRKLAAESSVAANMPAVLAELAKPLLFHLPPASLGHTRHYMPWFKKGPQDRTMVFDAFVAVDPDRELLLLWPDATLTASQEATLRLVLSQLGYFGRAESWCAAQLADGWQPQTDGTWTKTDQVTGRVVAETNCVPLFGNRIPPGREPVRVLAADPKTWNQWSYGNRARRPDPLWNLLAETADLHAERWSDPPGSQWIIYMRQADAFAVSGTARRSRPSKNGPQFRVARYALDGSVLPLVKETLPFAELVRRCLIGEFRKVIRRSHRGEEIPDSDPRLHSWAFSGKDESGAPLKSHAHAFFLPTDEDYDGRLDHLTVVAAMGFSTAEVQAFDALRRLKYEDTGTLNLMLTGLGIENSFDAPLFRKSAVWVSATPFLATRHLKRRGLKKDPPELYLRDAEKAFAQHVLYEELARLREQRPDLPAPDEVKPYRNHRAGAHRLRPIQFKRYRRIPGDDGGTRASGAFRITFPYRVAGPICLGHACHYGLGLFVPLEGEEADDE